MKNKSISLKKVPEIYCSLSIIFNKTVYIQQITNELCKIGIKNINVRFPKSENIVVFDIATICYEQMWNVSEALTKMFNIIDNCMVDLKALVNRYLGEFYIDIAFYQYGVFPSIVFSGENMRKIQFLEADISIDPY